MRLGKDLGLACRRLRKAPASTAVAILALALGMGANTAIFSVVDAALLRPLPYPQPNRLVQICRTNEYGDQGWIAPANFAEAMQDRSIFAAAAGYVESSFNLAGAGPPQRVAGYFATPEFFDVLGARPALGAGFSAADGERGHAPVAILSDRLWHERFGGDRALVGRTVDINGVPATVAGILPASFRFIGDADVFEPMVLSTQPQDRGAQVIHAIGRLQAGISLNAARARMDALGKRQEREFPKENAGQSLGVVGLQQEWTGNTRPALLLLFAAVGMVLLIACANLANLQLARAVSRHKEIAVRMALGAEPRRIFQQLLTESLLLALAGATAGLGLAWWAIRGIVSIAPAALTRAGTVSLDSRVLAFTALIAVLTGVLFGAAPALQASSVNVQAALQEGGRGPSDGGRRGRRLRKLLVAVEIALVLPLFAAGMLLGNSFLRLRAVNAGFNPQHMLTMNLSLAPQRYADSASRDALARRLLPQVRELPRVQAAAVVYTLPLALCPDLPATIEGRAPHPPDVPDLDWHPVSSQAFDAMGIALLRGRAILDSDTAQSTPVAVINARAAALWWPRGNPIGASVWLGKPLMGPELTEPWPRTIVGVVADVRQQDLEHGARPAIYIPFAQVPDSFTHVVGNFFPLTLVVRTTGATLAPAPAIEQAIWNVDPQQPVSDIRTMADIESLAIAPQRFNLMLIGLLALIALVLAAIGVYGVMAYAVSQRVHEIGVRMALGAGRGMVVRMILGEGLRLALVGLGIGFLAWLGAARLLTRFLYGVRPWDATTLAFTAIALTLIALAACGAPAWRAARMDPLAALRQE